MIIESDTLKETAKRLILKFERVGHIEVERCLFLIDHKNTPSSAARCYSLNTHPIKLFTDKDFCIVVYNQNTDWMTDEQMTILLLHELMHIPYWGNKLIDHNIKDFSGILEIDLVWNRKGAAPADILL